jgi:hypothetical protein
LHDGAKLLGKSKFEFQNTNSAQDTVLLAKMSSVVWGKGTNSSTVEAKFYQISSFFPRFEDIHKDIYQYATSNHNSPNWTVITNGKAYDRTLSGQLTRPERGISEPQPVRAKYARWLLLAISVSGLTLIIFSVFRKR